GRVTSGLPQHPLTSGLMDDFPEVTGMGSFADTLDYIQRHYSNRAAEAPVAAGEKKNPDWVASAHGDSDSTTESDDDEDEEDRNNLHNRATLDIYLPVPLDSLFRMMDQEKMISRRSRLRNKKFPIVISLNGGAWIIGSHFWSFLVARLLAARGYVVFCPDYRNFPQTDMEGMVLDVSDAIRWVL
ncbi:putative ecotin, partial [Trypanosoma grayi]|uniref:putative ecotin n=1 Tax=Trypanosoma grayi TaxID=71804 RepID=UPI0004F473AB